MPNVERNSSTTNKTEIMFEFSNKREQGTLLFVRISSCMRGIFVEVEIEIIGDIRIVIPALSPCHHLFAKIVATRSMPMIWIIFWKSRQLP